MSISETIIQNCQMAQIEGMYSLGFFLKHILLFSLGCFAQL